MCGIAALVGKMSAPAAEFSVQAMLDAQAHRGPDDQGLIAVTCRSGTVALGSRRLAIQDLSPLGHQPMLNPETGDALVYNGEIYNAPDLREQLSQNGYTFRGHSDTEVLLRAYECWGRKCLSRLRGMFAFCLWDARSGRLFVARDHLGIKPLYYSAAPGQWFACASEVKALLQSGVISTHLADRAIASYLAYGAVQEPLTIWKGILALPSGCWMEINQSGETLEEGRFWEPPPPRDADEINVSATLEEGRLALERAVRRHLISDVPVGIFLSSGLDSTIILALARAHHPHPEQLQAFTVSFPQNSTYDEAAVARSTARRFGVEYHEFPVEERTAIQWIREGLEQMDQPSMDGLNTYVVSRAVNERGIKVALSGVGGDELFGGYSLFRRVERLARALSMARVVPASLRVSAAHLLTLLMNPSVQGKAEDLACMRSDVQGIYFQCRRLMSNRDLALLGIDLGSMGLDNHFQSGLNVDRCLVPGDTVASLVRLDSLFYMGNTLLRDTDVFGMSKSLEIRVPFLDLDVIDWSFRLPGQFLLPRRALPKHLLRTMFREFFSKQQLRQPKLGFTLPFSTWLLGPLRDVLEDGLESLRKSGIVDPGGVQRVREMFLADPHSPTWSRLWSLVTLGYWVKGNKLNRSSLSPGCSAA